jgi:hypothetical protein
MLLIGLKNIGEQTVLASGLVNIGNVYRKYCKANRCGVPAFSVTSNGVTLNHEGIYHITATLVGTGETAGVVSVQLAENGELLTGAISTETITTATTEFRTFVLDYYIKVDKDCVLGVTSTDAKTISLVNVSEDIDATFTSVVLNVTKEV